MKITRSQCLQNKPESYDNLGFGKVFTDYMFVAKYNEGQWNEGEIVPFQNISLHPASTVLHYGQEIFEGMKAYKGMDGKVRLFRIEENIKRMNQSARLMAMPEIDESFFKVALLSLVSLESEWLLPSEKVSLYIRPFMFGVDTTLGLKPAEEYHFMILLSVSSQYYSDDSAVKIKVEHDHVRAFPRGIGNAKTGGNYAASLLSFKKAKEQGFDQVLWLDGIHQKYIEEVGAMNIMFVIDNVLVTPKLNDSILAGITRDSILQIAPSLGIDVCEREITIDEIIEAYHKGTCTEVFGCGTAVVVSSIGELQYESMKMKFSSTVIASKIKRVLLDLQYGNKTIENDWITIID